MTSSSSRTASNFLEKRPFCDPTDDGEAVGGSGAAVEESGDLGRSGGVTVHFSCRWRKR